MSTRARLLVVEGDGILRDLLAEQLSLASDLSVTATDRGGNGRTSLGEDVFDIVLANMLLPDMDGRDFITVIRQDGFRGPVVLLTPPGDDPESAYGLDAGASDVVAKPFKFAVLLARLRAQLRVHEASEEAAVSIGPYIFRAGEKTLTSEAGDMLRLTEKETAILRYLYRAGDGSVGRDTLLQEIWGYNPAVTTHTLETHIYRLRQKLETDPLGGGVLVTDPGGYRLMP